MTDVLVIARTADYGVVGGVRGLGSTTISPGRTRPVLQTDAEDDA